MIDVENMKDIEKKIITILAEENCTIEDAENILRATRFTLQQSTIVQKPE